MKGIYDLERYLVRLYKYSIESENRAIYINVNELERFNEFFICINQFNFIIDKLDIVFENRSKIKSKRLKNLVTFKKSNLKKTKSKKSKSANPFASDSDEEENKNNKRFSSLDKEKGNLLPDIRDELKKFEGMITWK